MAPTRLTCFECYWNVNVGAHSAVMRLVAEAVAAVGCRAGTNEIIIYGSVIRCTSNVFSDIDLVAVKPDADVPYRIGTSTRGIPVSTYVINRDALLGDVRLGTFGGFYAGKFALGAVPTNEIALQIAVDILAELTAPDLSEHPATTLALASPTFGAFVRHRVGALPSTLTHCPHVPLATPRRRIAHNWPPPDTMEERFIAEGQRHYPALDWRCMYDSKTRRAQ